MAEKVRLRLKYDLPGDAFIVLHVGNTRRIRNLEALAAVQGDGCQVLVVSSTTIRGDRGVRERLERAGCLVWNHYVASIQEVYALADCYVFPTLTETAAIDHPLSVLEAMACNLPVVTRRFGALPRVFAPGEGLYFVDTAGDLARAVQEVRRSEPPVATRAQVMGLDWRAIADQIAALYRELAPAPCAQQHGRRRPFGGLR
jgi:glycosyltransferase involved in cell wall biosynthesis